MEAQIAAMMAQQAQVLEQVKLLTTQNTELSQRLNSKDQEMQNLTATQSQQHLELTARIQAREGEIAMLTAAGTGALDGLGGGGGERSALAQKWAPDSFSGEAQEWRDWSLKFKSYMSPLHKGLMGRWMQKVDETREALATLSVLGESARPSASSLHSALIATDWRRGASCF